MKVLRLQRKVIMQKYIHGVLTVDGTKFSCHTLEAQDPEDQFPTNPIFAFALPVGTYKVKIKDYSYFPLVPTIIHKPYINIGLRECPVIGPRPGDVCVGTEFFNDGYLKGFSLVMQALENIIKADIDDWRKNAVLIIENAPDCVHRVENFGFTENNDFLQMFNDE